MNISYGKVDTLGLHYFGSMTASISHEIKNALAIINENAGLLGDLLALAERGRPLDPERMKTISENIQRRVQHANEITRKLNRFAHSINGKVISTSMREIIESTVVLLNRMTAMKGITVTVQQDDSITIKTIPFVLQNMLWICFDKIMQIHKSEENMIIDISYKKIESDINIEIKLNKNLPLDKILLNISEEAKPILFFLKMQIYADDQQNTIQLRVPQKFIE